MTKRRKRRKINATTKAKVALEALRERETLAQLAAKHNMNPVQISRYKKQALEGLVDLFKKPGTPKAERDQADLIASLYEEIGRLKVENDWLKKISDRLR